MCKVPNKHLLFHHQENEALLKAERIELQANTLERNMRIFKKKLKSIMEQQMAVVEEIEILELEDK